jgi:hypothetical protein
MIVNHEKLMQLYAQAKKSGTVETWVELASEFIGRQDIAMRDLRAGHREALAQAARDAERIKALAAELAEAKRHPSYAPWAEMKYQRDALRAALERIAALNWTTAASVATTIAREALRGADQPAERRQSSSDWWCPTCKRSVPGVEVTYNETHDERRGGCGFRVQEDRPSATDQTTEPLPHVHDWQMVTDAYAGDRWMCMGCRRESFVRPAEQQGERQP